MNSFEVVLIAVLIIAIGAGYISTFQKKNTSINPVPLQPKNLHPGGVPPTFLLPSL